MSFVSGDGDDTLWHLADLSSPFLIFVNKLHRPTFMIADILTSSNQVAYPNDRCPFLTLLMFNSLSAIIISGVLKTTLRVLLISLYCIYLLQPYY